MTPAQHTAPEAMVEACAKAICESLQADADAGDVGITENLDLDPAFWLNTAEAAIAAISGQIREAALKDAAYVCAKYREVLAGTRAEADFAERLRLSILALIEGANHEPL